jgi:hypothetical protein
MAFFENRHKEVNLIIDIGSASVAAALVLFSREEKPEVVFSKRLKISVEKWDRKKIFSALREALDTIITTTLKEGAGRLHLDEGKLKDKKISDVFCVFSSPWSSFHVETLKAKHDKAILISKESIESLIKQGMKKSLKPEQELIERKVIQTKLNGYRTSAPLGQQAKEIEISLFQGLLREEEAKNIEGIVLPRLHGKVFFHSLSLMTLVAIEEIFEGDSHFLTINITGETTEITLVRNEQIITSQFFPQGKNDFIRKAASEFEVETDIALSYIKLFYEKKTEGEFKGKIGKVIEEAENSWLNNFANALGSFPKDFLAAKVFLLTDRELEYAFLPLVEKALGNVSIKRSVKSIGNEPLDHFLNIRDTLDPFLAIEAIAIGGMK